MIAEQHNKTTRTEVDGERNEMTFFRSSCRIGTSADAAPGDVIPEAYPVGRAQRAQGMLCMVLMSEA